MGNEKKEGAPAAKAGAPEAKKESSAPAAKGGKAPSIAPGACHSWGCKKEEARFNFCEEHYDHFKFGLIKKTGEPVSDYEKKFAHYQAHVAKRGSHKVAKAG